MEELFDVAPKAWAAATSSSFRPVAWLTRRDALEYCNYLELVARLDGAPFDVVDVPRVQIPRADGGSVLLRHLALLAPEDIVTARLWEYRRPATTERIIEDRELWQRLKRENAALRVMRDGALVSAPITYYDDIVLGGISRRWQNGTRVVGEALGTVFEREDWIGNAFLWGRVRALARAGSVEIDGDAHDMREAKVRCA